MSKIVDLSAALKNQKTGHSHDVRGKPVSSYLKLYSVVETILIASHDLGFVEDVQQNYGDELFRLIDWLALTPAPDGDE